MCRYTAVDGWTSNKAVVQWRHSVDPAYQSVPVPSLNFLSQQHFSQVKANSRYSPIVKDSISCDTMTVCSQPSIDTDGPSAACSPFSLCWIVTCCITVAHLAL